MLLRWIKSIFKAPPPPDRAADVAISYATGKAVLMRGTEVVGVLNADYVQIMRDAANHHGKKQVAKTKVKPTPEPVWADTMLVDIPTEPAP